MDKKTVLYVGGGLVGVVVLVAIVRSAAASAAQAAADSAGSVIATQSPLVSGSAFDTGTSATSVGGDLQSILGQMLTASTVQAQTQAGVADTAITKTANVSLLDSFLPYVKDLTNKSTYFTYDAGGNITGLTITNALKNLTKAQAAKDAAQATSTLATAQTGTIAAFKKAQSQMTSAQTALSNATAAVANQQSKINLLQTKLSTATSATAKKSAQNALDAAQNQLIKLQGAQSAAQQSFDYVKSYFDSFIAVKPAGTGAV